MPRHTVRVLLVGNNETIDVAALRQRGYELQIHILPTGELAAADPQAYDFVLAVGRKKNQKVLEGLPEELRSRTVVQWAAEPLEDETAVYRSMGFVHHVLLADVTAWLIGQLEATKQLTPSQRWGPVEGGWTGREGGWKHEIR